MKKKIILSIFALIGLSLLYFFKFDDSKRQVKHASIEKKPQEYMIQAVVTTFEENGVLKEKLSTSRWAYLPEAQLSTLLAPHLTAYKPDGTIWLINAKKGIIKQPTLGAIEEIELQNDVVIKRPATKKAVPIKLETSKLNYHPKKEFAENDQPVIMTKPGLKITGIGLRAFLDESSVEILRDVETHYTLR